MLPIIYDDIFLQHQTPPGHPESAARVQAIVGGLREAALADQLRWLQARPASEVDVARCHTDQYMQLARREIQSGATTLSTGDTEISPGSWEAALHAAGATCLAVDQVMRDNQRCCFCIVRPPGHHASCNRGMGFCVFNNAAIATRYAQSVHGLERVLIVDWDVHHGNGTQDIFYEDERVFFFSTHQSPWYPGTGAADETGSGKGRGTTLNCPLPSGSGRKEILGAFTDRLLPAAQAFKPDLIIISAGFDSRLGDPLGEFRLTDEDFAELTRLILKLAAETAEGRCVSVLEGGYNLSGLASAAHAHVQVLVEASRPGQG